MYKFEGLQVWQETLKLATICYNIAEGSGAESDKEFLRFLHTAKKSLFETISILKFIEHIYKKDELKKIYPNCDIVGKLLSGLIRKLNSDKI
jgi:four helix bundle protein